MAKVPSTFYPKVSPEIPWETRKHLQLIYQKLSNHAIAFSNVGQGGESIVNNTIQNFGGGSGGGGGGVIPGGVNNQTGATSYTTQASDNGVLLVVGSASPVTVSLNSGVSSPFFLYITNFGTSTTTLIPTSGTLTGGTTLQPEDFSVVFYDGSNWWSTLTNVVILQNNGSLNSSQTLLNLVNGSNITITDLGAGDIRIAATGSLSLVRLPHNQTGGRFLGVTYQNTTGTEMVISGYATTNGGSTGGLQCLIVPVSASSQVWAEDYTATLSTGRAGFSGLIVPDTYFYEIVTVPGAGSAITGIGLWVEYY